MLGSIVFLGISFCGGGDVWHDAGGWETEGDEEEEVAEVDVGWWVDGRRRGSGLGERQSQGRGRWSRRGDGHIQRVACGTLCMCVGRLKVGEGCPKEADLGDGDLGPTRSGRRGGLS